MDTVIICRCSHIIGDHDTFGCEYRGCSCPLSREAVIDRAITELRRNEWSDAQPAASTARR